MFLIFIAAFLFGAGLYLILAAALHLPGLYQTRLLLSVANAEKREQVRSFDTVTLALSSKLAAHYKMDEYKKHKLTAQLYAANMTISPETYVVKAWLSALLFAFLSVPAFFVFPLAAPVFLILAVILYFMESRSADKAIEKKKEAIETELPRFVGFIAQEVQQRTGVITMLEGYMRNAGEELKSELSITVSDMKTGNDELALKRMDMRVGSSMLNEIVQGLLLTVAGNDESRYFQSLQDQFLKYQKQQLLKEVMKRPDKMRKYSAIILLVYILTYFVILGLALMDSLNGIF